MHRLGIVLFAASLCAVAVADNQKKQDALTYLHDAELRLTDVYGCLSCEALRVWNASGIENQEWIKLVWTPSGYWQYSGLTASESKRVADPQAWLEGKSNEILEKHFYNYSIGNTEYTAQLVDLSAFDSAGGKELEAVSPVVTLRPPPIVELIYGRAFVGVKISDYLQLSSVEVVEFVKDEQGAVRIGTVGPQSEFVDRNRTKRVNYTWILDQSTGLCRAASEREEGEKVDLLHYEIEYRLGDKGVLLPQKVRSGQSKEKADHTTYIRNCQLQCQDNLAKSRLLYYGFDEPKLSSRARGRRWEVWATAGILLLLLGYTLHKRGVANSSRGK